MSPLYFCSFVFEDMYLYGLGIIYSRNPINQMEILFFLLSFLSSTFFSSKKQKILPIFPFFTKEIKIPTKFIWSTCCIRNSRVEINFKIEKKVMDSINQTNKIHGRLQKDIGPILTGPQFALDYCPLFEGHFLCDVMIIGRAA